MADLSAGEVNAVTRRARLEGRRGGRAEAVGRPLAETLEQLPGRRWIAARFGEFIHDAERQLVTLRRRLNEEAEVSRARLSELAREQEHLTERIAELAPVRDTDRSRPRHQQNLALEYELQSARDRLRATGTREHELKLELARLREQLEEIDREFTARPTRLRAARGTTEHEHDIAFRRAQRVWYGPIARRLLRAPGARVRTGRAEA